MVPAHCNKITVVQQHVLSNHRCDLGAEKHTRLQFVAARLCPVEREHSDAGTVKLCSVSSESEPLRCILHCTTLKAA